MSKCWQGTETPTVGTGHHFHFLLNEIRGEVWLVWHRNCQALTLQRFRSEYSSCCLPQGTQELVQVFEIQGLSIIKKESDSYSWKALESSLERFQWNTKKIPDFWSFFARIMEEFSNLCADVECRSLQWGCTAFNSQKYDWEGDAGLLPFFLLLCSFVVF